MVLLYDPGRFDHALPSRISQGDLTSMTARIFKPAKNAMQSGAAKTKEWQLDYEPEQPRAIEPLMGWTSSAPSVIFSSITWLGLRLARTRTNCWEAWN